MRRWAGQIGALILACAPWVALDASELSRAADLRAAAGAAARTGQPLIVIYSRDDCKFCQTIKREHLAPMAADTRRGKRPVIREISQDRDTPLIDFQGQATTHAAFAARAGDSAGAGRCDAATSAYRGDRPSARIRRRRDARGAHGIRGAAARR